MIHKIEAMVLFVQDLAGCTAFYRDTFKLQYKGSDADSASFLLEDGLYLILLSPSGAADLLGTEVNELKIEGGPRGLLAAGVADADRSADAQTGDGHGFIGNERPEIGKENSIAAFKQPGFEDHRVGAIAVDRIEFVPLNNELAARGSARRFVIDGISPRLLGVPVVP